MCMCVRVFVRIPLFTKFIWFLHLMFSVFSENITVSGPYFYNYV